MLQALAQPQIWLNCCRASSRCSTSSIRQLQQLHYTLLGTGTASLPLNTAATGSQCNAISSWSSVAPQKQQQQQRQEQQHKHVLPGTTHTCIQGLWQQQQQQQHRSLLTSCSSAPLPAQQQAAHSPQRLGALATLTALQHQHHHHQQQQQQTAFQLQQVRGVKQLRPYAEAPKLPPKFKRPDKDGRLNRMVIRIPPQVQLTVEDGTIKLTGKAGQSSLKLSMLDPSGLVAWRCLSQSAAEAAAGPGSGSLLLLVSPSKRHWRAIQTHIDNAVHGVMQGYLVGLTVQGVGYRLEPVAEDVVQAAIRARKGDVAAADGSVKRSMFWEQEAEKTNIAYPHKQPAKAVRLKVGFTKAAVYPLPEGVVGFFVKPSLMYLYGIDKHLVTNTAAAIRGVRPPNPYTGNGIQLVGEPLRLRQRAGSK